MTRIDPKGLVDSTWNVLYPPNFNTQDNSSAPSANVDAKCWADCRLKKQAICMSIGLGVGSASSGVVGTITGGTGAYPAFAIGDGVGTLTCNKVINMDCNKRCQKCSGN